MRLTMSHTWAKTFNLSTIGSSLGFRFKQFNGFTHLFKRNLKGLVPYHFTLANGEVFQVPSACSEVRVLSGVAWITVAGQDLILTSGEKALVASKKGGAILSALGNLPLIVEVL